MRKYSIATIIVAMCSFVSAQNIEDVIRFSTENTIGTARFQSMSGAFGALGGDLSAIAINPAGGAVFNNSYVSFTAGNYNSDNSATYFNGFNNLTDNSIELNQLGSVFVLNNTNPSSRWKKISLGINYDLNQNFDNEILISANNSNQPLSGYFLNYADSIPFGQILIQDGEYIEDAYLNIARDLGFGAQQAFLGYYGGLIDPVNETDTNTSYVTTGSDLVNQTYTLKTFGYNSKFTFNMAGQYMDNIYLGASLNFHAVNFEKFTELNESGHNNTSSGLTSASFRNLLFTEGGGFSFNLGGIAKVNESLRLGLAYQSPTWYKLQDEFSQEIRSNIADSDINFINFNNTSTLFEKHKIKTPAKITASAALVFGKEGLVSFDYSYQDMSKAELRPGNIPSFASENDYISKQLNVVNSYRIGAEYRIEQWSLRGGYRFEDSPYKDDTIGDLNGFSLGLGYNFGATKLDIGFNQTKRDSNILLYETGLPTTAKVDSKNTNIGVSLSFNL